MKAEPTSISRSQPSAKTGNRAASLLHPRCGRLHARCLERPGALFEAIKTLVPCPPAVAKPPNAREYLPRVISPSSTNSSRSRMASTSGGHQCAKTKPFGFMPFIRPAWAGTASHRPFYLTGRRVIRSAHPLIELSGEINTGMPNMCPPARRRTQ